LSELIKWFEKRKEKEVLANVQRHLALTISIVEDLEKAIETAVKNDLKEMQASIGRVTAGESEADSIRRRVMDEVSAGELSPTDREDLMGLIKKVDMIADWSRESTRVLNAIQMQRSRSNQRRIHRND